ncbi:MAG TPA: gluconokinase, GntK/IdnK-type [Polyangiaceae bacterium]
MIVIVMGVTGSGKSTIGKLLADRLGISFYDADDFHSAANRAKMAKNVPLDDADRWPWLELLAKHSVEWEAQGGAVLACSAVKQAYRDLLLAHVPNHHIVYLELSRDGAARRLEARRGHHEFVRDFDHILDGQFRDLEPPMDANTISAELSPPEIVERAAAALSTVSHH